MHEIYELKEKLMKELEEYGTKELSAGSLETVDKLAHAIKNLCKIIEAAEEEYSGDGRSYNRSYASGGNSRYSREGGGSYARGRGRNARRDSMGRYSSEGGYSRADELEGMVESIRGMMGELPMEVQQDAERFIKKLEQQM